MLHAGGNMSNIESMYINTAHRQEAMHCHRTLVIAHRDSMAHFYSMIC